VSKKAFFKGGLIISLLLLVIFPALAEGVTTFLTEGFEGDFSGGAPSGWTKSYKAEPSIGRETSAIL
jgi:cytochrome bd-type quinol oxidase subunit 2